MYRAVDKIAKYHFEFGMLPMLPKLDVECVTPRSVLQIHPQYRLHNIGNKLVLHALMTKMTLHV